MINFENTRINNYIVFSYIKNFVDDLCESYEDEPLHAYKAFLDDANVLTDTQEFVSSFCKGIDGTKIIKYCEGVYLNIPKYINLDDGNKEIIEKHLEKIKIMYTDPNNCEELQFLKTKGVIFTNDIDDTIIEESVKSESYMKKLMDIIQPQLLKSQQEFRNLKLNSSRCIKILLVGLYDKICNDEDVEDSKPICNIINIAANTPLDKIIDKKHEILTEIVQLKHIDLNVVAPLMSGKM